MMADTKPLPAIRHDGQLTLAFGHNRNSKSWKNKTLLWSQLLEKLSQTTRTRETMAEYDAMQKPQQDEIKDVGGFVGGSLKGGRRKAENVAWRHILTLDADFAPVDMWEQVTVLNSFACCIYSTHKHRTEKPRLRLVAPMKRPATPDEYQAISRAVAADIGSVDWWDDTTYEPSRLMYWASTSADGEFVFKMQDGAWLDPDEILAGYGPDDAWKDPANWPESSLAKQQRRKMADKQGDPLTKPGLIGAFCRTYSIDAAIETFLPDIYEKTNVEGRYTYAKGSTAGGLVLYDEERFAYSHHGTDPISGKLVNAWDLVRIHKFGVQDEDCAPDTPGNKLPSQVAMQELAGADEAVRIELGNARIAQAQEEFSIILDNPDWMKYLEVDGRGNYRSTPRNIMFILECDPQLKGLLTEDSFAHRLLVNGDLPWRYPGERHQWGDKDESSLRNYLHSKYGIKGRGDIQDALNNFLLKHSFHPVRDYLNKLEWDGVDRIDSLIIDYLGAEDSAYTRAVTRKMLVAAVARVMAPGIKFDNVLVLVGPQGIGKSYLLNKLGGRWFSDSIDTFSGKEAYEAIQGVWIIEIGELAAMRKHEVEQIKHFLSKQHDRFRVPYDRNTSDFPRQCVFFGSTNRSEFLRDATGNRRFWPVQTMVTRPAQDLFNDFTEFEVDQVWAEALVRWKAKEPLYLDQQLTLQAIKAQEEHMDESDKTGPVLEFLEMKLPADWEEWELHRRREWLRDDYPDKEPGTQRRNKVCVLEIWCELFNGDSKMLNSLTRNEIRDILLRARGWTPYNRGSRGRLRFGAGYGLQNCFVRSLDTGEILKMDTPEENEAWLT